MLQVNKYVRVCVNRKKRERAFKVPPVQFIPMAPLGFWRRGAAVSVTQPIHKATVESLHSCTLVLPTWHSPFPDHYTYTYTLIKTISVRLNPPTWASSTFSHHPKTHRHTHYWCRLVEWHELSWKNTKAWGESDTTIISASLLLSPPPLLILAPVSSPFLPSSTSSSFFMLLFSLLLVGKTKARAVED